jgi:hypothetical protein
MERVRRLVVALLLTILLAVPTVAETPAPVLLSSRGYVNEAPLTAHTTMAFNSNGASTLVAFVSTHPSWNGQRVIISSLNDNAGNTWNVLIGPSTWTGGSFALLSAIYYVNAPVTNATHQVTVNLTNPAPLVVHVFAVSGSDITGPPIYSSFTSPAVGGTSADVTAKPIAIPADTLLLGWAKNESNATATALDGYTLDQQSTSYLWGEFQTVHTAGWYTSRFRYDTAIGWQTAVVGLKVTTRPVASSQAVVTDHDAPVSITLSSFSTNSFPGTCTLLTWPTHGALSGIVPNMIYTPYADYTGPDAFTFRVNDGAAVSNTASVGITVRGRTFIQRLRESTMKIGVFSIIWGIAIGVMLPFKKSSELFKSTRRNKRNSGAF